MRHAWIVFFCLVTGSVCAQYVQINSDHIEIKYDKDFNRDYLAQALTTAQSVNTGALQQQGINGKALGEALRTARISAIENM